MPSLMSFHDAHGRTKIKNMPRFNFKTLSYNAARQNYTQRVHTKKAECTKWDSLEGERLLESFSAAERGGFMSEFLDDLLSEKEFERLAAKLKVLEYLFMGMPYSH